MPGTHLGIVGPPIYLRHKVKAPVDRKSPGLMFMPPPTFASIGHGLVWVVNG